MMTKFRGNMFGTSVDGQTDRETNGRLDRRNNVERPLSGILNFLNFYLFPINHFLCRYAYSLCLKIDVISKS